MSIHHEYEGIDFISQTVDDVTHICHVCSKHVEHPRRAVGGQPVTREVHSYISAV